jgi:hypothetical protein
VPIPNEADAPYADQSEIDHVDIQSMERVAAGYVVFSGGVVTAQGTPDGTVAVSSGTARMNGSSKTITGGNVSVITGSANPDGTTAAAGDSTLARFSLVTLNASSQLGVIHGSLAALSPNNDGSYLAVFPSVSSTVLVLAAVFVPPNTSTVSSSQIQDKRILGSVDALHDRDHLISGSTHTGTLSVAQGLGKPQALTGAVSATNYVGGTASVAPTTGTFAVGDYVVTQDGKIWVCTSAGTPGTWTQVGGAGGSVATDAIFDAAGDLVQGTGANTSARLARGSSFTDSLMVSGTSLAWIPSMVRKTADETVTSSATLQNDDHLFWAIGTGSEIWFFQMFLAITSSSVTPDFKCGFTVPAGTTMRWAAHGETTGWSRITAGNGAMLSDSGTVTAGSISGTEALELKGWVFGSTTAGNVQFQWAQNTSDGAGVTIEDNSLLLLTRLA